MAKIILDAGHGGIEPGAVYEGRSEKDDTLRLVFAVGEILEKEGIEVAYTRTEDVYQTPFEKAQAANEAGGDYLVSIHRNSSPEPNQYSGVELLVYDRSGNKVKLAEQIGGELEAVGFRNLGVKERPRLVILRRSQMPAVLVEVGFINTDMDNALFDESFEQIAQAIADGIVKTLWEEGKMAVPAGEEDAGDRMIATAESVYEQENKRMKVWKDERPASCPCAEMRTCCGTLDGVRIYRVQVGAFVNRKLAEDLLYELQRAGYPAYILFEDQLNKVQVGAFRELDNAVRMEEALRKCGYTTFISD